MPDFLVDERTGEMFEATVVDPWLRRRVVDPWAWHRARKAFRETMSDDADGSKWIATVCADPVATGFGAHGLWNLNQVVWANATLVDPLAAGAQVLAFEADDEQEDLQELL